MEYNVHLSLKSRNGKTGPIPVSTTTDETCPPDCPFLKAGCYAKLGHIAMHWKKVTSGDNAMSWSAFCDAIKSLPLGQLWRHNQAGDLPGIGAQIDTRALSALVKANRGKLGFTYTHKPMATPASRRAIARANKAGFTINLSGNNLAHADQLYDLGIAPVVTVLPMGSTSNTVTPKGRKVVICPATQRDDVTCASCGLCARIRDCIVGFPAHGVSAKRASAVASA